jgi:hypothetical protein
MNIEESEVIHDETNKSDELQLELVASTRSGKSRLNLLDDLNKLIGNDEDAKVSDKFIVKKEEPVSTKNQ